jgi:sugar/nucleoside kinase (ribokinase family)
MSQILTAGGQGALARTRSGQTITAAALTVDVQQVQGAGAAFSAALIHARCHPPMTITALMK